MWASRGPLSSADAKEGLQQSEHGMGTAGAEDGTPTLCLAWRETCTTFIWFVSLFNGEYSCFGFPSGSVVRNPSANAGHAGSIPASGRSPGGGNGNWLQYSCAENSMDRGAWRAVVHGVTKRQIWLSVHTDTCKAALKCCVGFGCTVNWISCKYIHTYPLPLGPLSHPAPPIPSIQVTAEHKLSSLQVLSDVLLCKALCTSFFLTEQQVTTDQQQLFPYGSAGQHLPVTWVRVSQGWNQCAGQAGLLPRGSGKTPTSEFIRAMGRAQVLAVRGPAFLGCGWQALLSAPGGWLKAGPFQVPTSILKPASGYLLVLRPFHALNLVSSATSWRTLPAFPCSHD